MGLIGILVKVVGAIVLIVVGLGAYLYFTDYEANAAVTGRASDAECPPTADSCAITVTPKIAPMWHYSKQVDRSAWQVVCVGFTVDFRLQTHEVKVYDQAKTLVYDSTDPNATNLAALAKCAASNVV